MTRRVLEHGDIAVATLRKPEALKDLAAQYTTDRLLVLKVDVTVHQDILDAFKATKEVFGRLDVVVNNAGYAVLGEIEGTPDDVARAMFEVNFWGATHVAQEAVRFFREDNATGKGGRIINITSGTGIIGYPSFGLLVSHSDGRISGEPCERTRSLVEWIGQGVDESTTVRSDHWLGPKVTV